MCSDRNFVGPHLKKKKLPINPCKIGKILKNKRLRKLKLISELKKRVKMRKDIQQEILRSPLLSSLSNSDPLIKLLKKPPSGNVRRTIKRRRLLENTLVDKKIKVQVTKSPGDLKSADETELKVCRKHSGNWNCSKISSEVAFPNTKYQSVSDDKTTFGAKAKKEVVNPSITHSLSEVYDSGTEGDDSSVYSIESSSSETQSKSNVDFSASSGSVAEDSSSSREVHETKAEFHHLYGNCYLLILRHPCQIFFRGSLLVTPISGKTSFLGYEFAPGMKSHLVFSPKGISPLCLGTTGHINDPKEVSKISGLDENILKRLNEKDSSLLIEPASGEYWNKLNGCFNRLLKFNPLTPTRKIFVINPGIDVEYDLGVEFVQPTAHISSKSFHTESIEWKNLFWEIQRFNHQKDNYKAHFMAEKIQEQALRKYFSGNSSCHINKKPEAHFSYKATIFSGQVRVMVFGGKGVGKSTFMRYLVNRWLSASYNDTKQQERNKNEAILFIDFDPGQSELVPPGCLSVTLVSEPLLGPNYTHLRDPERMMCVGDIDVSKCPKWYLHCANDLVEFCTSNETLSKLPWFINTMGFCRGIGADLAVKLIHLCRPTHVIQMKSIWSRRNFDPIDFLSWSSVKSGKVQDWNEEVAVMKEDNLPEYSYHQLQSLAERSFIPGEMSKQTNLQDDSTIEVTENNSEEVEDIDSQWGLPAWQSRELCVLAYFSRMVEEPRFSILKPEPHMFRLSDIVLSLPSAMVIPRYITAVFNARLVALCSLGGKAKRKRFSGSDESEEANHESALHDKGSKKPWENFITPSNTSHASILFHMPLDPCLGFGIVRGIDNSNHEIYVTTPLSKEILASVDCIATSPTIGSIPKPLILDAVKERPNAQFIPYVMTKNASSTFSRTVPRIYQQHLSNSVVKQQE